MTGRSHIAFASIAAADCVAGVIMAKIYLPSDSKLVLQAISAISDFFDPMAEFGGLAGCLLVGAAIILYYIGVLLPDIDTSSTISNALHFKLPLKHRGFTHSLWAACLFLMPSLIWYEAWISRFVAAGMICHDLADSFSPCGWVPFYPFGKYRIVHGNVVCSRMPHIKLYSSEKKGSEKIVNIAFGVISAFCAAGVIMVRSFL